MENSEKIVVVRQVGSAIRRSKKQSFYLKSLGLRHVGSEKKLILNNSVLALIKKVSHIVEVIS